MEYLSFTAHLLLSGLDTGIALLVMVSVFLPAAIDVAGFHLLGTIDIVLIILLLVRSCLYRSGAPVGNYGCRFHSFTENAVIYRRRGHWRYDITAHSVNYQCFDT